MSQIKSFLALVVVTTSFACAPTLPPPARPERGADCPERPDALTRIEEIEILGRSAREARANLITQWPENAPPAQRIVATLHDPHLSLIEAILRTPRKARRPDEAWLQANLVRASIELRSRTPIAALERGDRHSLKLTIQGMGPLPILAVSRQQDGDSLVYRLGYDPVAAEHALSRIELQVPMEGRRGPATFRWALSQSNLQRLDALPIAYDLAWQRVLVWARRAALLGQNKRALALVERAHACEPSQESKELLVVLKRQGGGEERKVDFGASDEPGASADFAPPSAAALSMRAAVLARLAAAARRGLFSSIRYTKLQKALQEAAQGLQPKKLLAFDRALMEGLSEALSPRGPIGAMQPTLRALEPTNAPTTQRVERELMLRIAFAAHDLSPWLVAAPRPPLDAPRLVVAQGQGKDKLLHTAQLYRTLGARYFHPGLSEAARAHTLLLVPPASYWQRWAGAVKTRKALETLARRALTSAVAAQNAQLLNVAARGLEGDRANAALEHHKAHAAQLAALLEGLRAKTVSQLKAQLSSLIRHSAPRVRAAVIAAFGRAKELAVVRSALQDPDPRVSASAIVALIPHGDAAASLKLAAVLLRAGDARRHLLERLSIIRSTKILARDRATLERRLAPLYRKEGGLRASVLEIATHLRLRGVLQQGLRDEAIALRRRAAAGIAALQSPPIKLLRQLASDADPEIKLSGQIGLARLRDASALLNLGAQARRGCIAPARVIPVLASSMDENSRRRLLGEILSSPCRGLATRIWPVVDKYFPRDADLLKAGLGHQEGKVRVLAAITTLGH